MCNAFTVMSSIIRRIMPLLAVSTRTALLVVALLSILSLLPLHQLGTVSAEVAQANRFLCSPYRIRIENLVDGEIKLYESDYKYQDNMHCEWLIVGMFGFSSITFYLLQIIIIKNRNLQNTNLVISCEYPQ